MSTPPAAPPPSASSSSPSSSASSSALSDTSTLLFGFLVSALSIFAIFMTVAIVWNRLVARRRAIDAMLETSPPLHPQRLQRPTMWDVWAVPDTRPPPWADIKPMAAQRCHRTPSAAQATQAARTIQFWRHRVLNYLPPEITYLFHAPIIPQGSAASSDTDISQVELSHGSDIQISLLISMPCAPHSKHARMLHELGFATTNVIYHDTGPS